MIPPRSNSGNGSFPTTRWSILFALRDASDPVEAREMLDGICAIYWRPINIFLRASGYNYDDAQDLTQRFILHLIERERFAQADPARGRFRSYVLGALKYFLAHVRQEERAQKRGGGAAVIPLDEATIGEIETAETSRGRLAQANPSDRQWGIALIPDRSGTRMVYTARRKAPIVQRSRPIIQPLMPITPRQASIVQQQA